MDTEVTLLKTLLFVLNTIRRDSPLWFLPNYELLYAVRSVRVTELAAGLATKGTMSISVYLPHRLNNSAFALPPP
jgi:hypothetical protein